MREEDLAAARAERMRAEAFEAGRFLIYVLREGCVETMQMPTYDEARTWLRMYVAPFVLRLGGTLQHNTWSAPLPTAMESTTRRPEISRDARWQDMTAVEIWTETEEQRLKLHEILNEVCAKIISEREETR